MTNLEELSTEDVGTPTPEQTELTQWRLYALRKNKELQAMMDSCHHLSVRNSSKGPHRRAQMHEKSAS